MPYWTGHRSTAQHGRPGQLGFAAPATERGTQAARRTRSLPEAFASTCDYSVKLANGACNNAQYHVTRRMSRHAAVCERVRPAPDSSGHRFTRLRSADCREFSRIDCAELWRGGLRLLR